MQFPNDAKYVLVLFTLKLGDYFSNYSLHICAVLYCTAIIVLKKKSDNSLLRDSASNKSFVCVLTVFADLFNFLTV